MKNMTMAYFSHGCLCRRRHKQAIIAEPNLIFGSRFLRRISVCGMRIIMHLFLRAIGFSQFNESQEEKLIESAAMQTPDKNAFIKKCEYYGRAELLVPVSDSTGISVYGKLADGKFKPLYYYPILMGSSKCDNEELSVERHYDKESFEVICEDIKAGVTLMFYLQNCLDYLNFRAGCAADGSKQGETMQFCLDRKNAAEKEGIAGKKVVLSALSVGGMIILPATKKEGNMRMLSPREAAKEAARKNLIAAAKNGDQDAIESLTIEDLDTYTTISRRIVNEDVLSIVETSFMPCGVECDQYAVIGEILEIERQTNVITDETIIIMKLDCNDIIFDMAINAADLVGEPAVGRRFKGAVWLQGEVLF